MVDILCLINLYSYWIFGSSFLHYCLTGLAHADKALWTVSIGWNGLDCLVVAVKLTIFANIIYYF